MKSYNQWCPIAQALDVVGDRWTLLVLRELVIQGPCRYTDLANGLPGIATSVLADRLRSLEDAGLIRREAAPPVILALPGSRRTIAGRLMPDFGAALGQVARALGEIDLVLPTVPHMAERIAALAADWPVKPRIVVGEAEKFAAFRSARAALAASGTVTLELALAGVPTVGAYKVSRLEEPLKYLVKVSTILLPNLILGDNAIPEILQRECTPDRLAAALLDVIRPGPARDAQLAALGRLDARMRLPDGERPSSRAASVILALLAARVAPALAPTRS